MTNILAAFVAALVIAGPHPEVPPNNPIPDDLEICILEAELCAAQHYQPQCGWMDFFGLEQCTTDYEDCAWWIDEMHELGCRQSHATCSLEAPLYPNEQWYQDYCAKVDAVCPSYW